MEPLPKTWQNYLEHAGELMSYIKTYDQQTGALLSEDVTKEFKDGKVVWIYDYE